MLAEPIVRGFEVVRVLAPRGVSETACAQRHIVALHVGEPVHATCTRGGRVWSGIQETGDIEIIPVGDGGRWVDEAPADLISVRIEAAFLNSVAAGLGIDPRRLELAPQSRARDCEIEYIGRALDRACANADGGASLLIDSLGIALGARLIERFANLRPERAAGRLSPRQLNAVVDYVDAHLAEPMTLKDLAGVAGVSISHFKTLFKSAKGLPAHTYVVRRRVERAAQLIKQGDQPLSQIALEAGFSHQSHLARSMRKTIGLTPGKLARAYR